MELKFFPGLIVDKHKFLIFGLAPELKGRRISHIQRYATGAHIDTRVTDLGVVYRN